MTDTPGSMTDASVQRKTARTERTKLAVIEAAIRCFQRTGEQHTSIEDIAREAQISRRSLYRLYEDRPTLLQHIVVHILESLQLKVRAQLVNYETVEEAIVEGALYQVNIALADPVFQDIMYKSTRHRIEKLLFSADKLILKSLIELWGPIIERGKTDGVIKPNLTTERVVELAASCNATLLMRDDLDEDAKRRFLRDLLWAAIKA